MAEKTSNSQAPKPAENKKTTKAGNTISPTNIFYTTTEYAIKQFQQLIYKKVIGEYDGK